MVGAVRNTYYVLRGRIKGFNSYITTIIYCWKLVVIELWLGSYRTVVG